MSNFKLHFKLKQHTPLIHFQHDQAGATLRATELKPKLDRFILTKLGGGNYQSGIQKAKENGWLIDNDTDKPALDYKIRIKPTKKQLFYIPYNIHLNNDKKQDAKNKIKRKTNVSASFLTPSPYFGNSDKIKFIPKTNNFDLNKSKINELLFAILSEENIDVQIHCFISNLKNYIEENIIDFFLINNFGTRQNKGFGSFTVININKKEIDNNLLDEKIKHFFLKKIKLNNLNQVFKFITEEYQLLKSGINLSFGTNPRYDKSELFKYFINENIRWEKRFIKQKLNKNGVQLKQQSRDNYEPIDYNNSTKSYYNSYEDVQNNEYRFIRALLGLAENYEFATYNKGRLKVKIKHNKHSGEETIERFKSPVFFKVIDNNVYVTYDETYKNIEDKEFYFHYFDGKEIQLGSLKVPKNFDLKDFLNNHLSNEWQNI